jgi:hypothetical protein
MPLQMVQFWLHKFGYLSWIHKLHLLICICHCIFCGCDEWRIITKFIFFSLLCCCFLDHLWCQGGKLIQSFASSSTLTLLVNFQILDVWNQRSSIISIIIQCVMFGSPFNYVFSYVSCLECTTFTFHVYLIYHYSLKLDNSSASLFGI